MSSDQQLNDDISNSVPDDGEYSCLEDGSVLVHLLLLPAGFCAKIRPDFLGNPQFKLSKSIIYTHEIFKLFFVATC